MNSFQDLTKSTQNHMLRLGGNGPIEMFGFSDASHITAGKSKSRYGGALYLGLDSGAFWSMRMLQPSHYHHANQKSRL